MRLLQDALHTRFVSGQNLLVDTDDWLIGKDQATGETAHDGGGALGGQVVYAHCPAASGWER